MSGSVHDVFLSYCSADRAATEPLVAALDARGLRVFRDDRGIPLATVDLTADLRDALATSRLLVAWATPAWWERPACREELTAAACSAAAEGRAIMQRVVLVVPPGDQGPLVRAALAAFFRQSRVEAADDPGALADAIERRVAEAGGSMGAAADRERRRWIGRRPTRYPRFVGREVELWATHAALMSASAAALSSTPEHVTESAQVHGLGGNGKSLLAVEYALRFEGAWPGGVVWIDAAGSTPMRAQQSVLASLDLPSQPPGGDLADGAAQWVAQRVRDALGDRPLLWVVDDPAAPDADSTGVAPLVEWRCPASSGRTLLTTRVGPRVGFMAVPVGVLEDGQALALLQRGASWDATEMAAALEIVEMLGGHPLAVDVAGAMLARYAWTPSKLRARLASDGPVAAMEKALMAAGSRAALIDQLPTRHEPSVVRTLALSWEALAPASQLVLRVCASLAETDVPVALVEAAIGGEADEAIAQAVDSGLASRVEGRLRKEDPACPALRVHGLARQVAVLLWKDAEAVEAVEAALEARMGEAITQVAEAPWRHGEVRPMLEHAEVLGRRWQRGTGNLPMSLGIAWRSAGELGRARANEAAAAAAREAVHGLEHANTLAAMSNLAGTLQAQGDLTGARSLLERALDAMTRLLGPEHPDTLTTLQNLAVTLQGQGDLTGARSLLERALEARTRLLGPEHPHTLGTLQNLALTLQAQGDLSSARRLYERALEARIRLLGAEHPQTLTTLQNLASTLKAQGDLTSARRLYERALEARTRMLGPEHPDTLTTLQNLAGTLQAQGDLTGARGLLEPSLDARARLLGPEHPDTLATLQNLAGTLYAQGDLAGAQRLFERALEAMTRLLGPEHPNTLTVLQNLAGTLKAQGDLSGAQRLFERALGAMTRLLGPEHPNTLGTVQNLAGTLAAQGDLTGARGIYERTLETMTRVLGPEHPYTLAALQNLALTLQTQGDLTGARGLYERALDAMTRVLGSEHPDTLNTLQNLAGTIQGLGDLAGARGLYEHALEARTSILGPEHPDTLNTLQNLAGTLQAQGDLSGARRLYERALEAMTRLLGPEHPNTLTALQNLAATLYAQGDLTGARGLEERALEARTRLLGADHPHTLTALQNLALTLKAQGDLTGARGLLERTLEARTRLLGPEHPNTTKTRYDLVLTLRRIDPAAAADHIAILGRLRDRDPATLSAVERRVLAGIYDL